MGHRAHPSRSAPGSHWLPRPINPMEETALIPQPLGHAARVLGGVEVYRRGRYSRKPPRTTTAGPLKSPAWRHCSRPPLTVSQAERASHPRPQVSSAAGASWHLPLASSQPRWGQGRLGYETMKTEGRCMSCLRHAGHQVGTRRFPMAVGHSQGRYFGSEVQKPRLRECDPPRVTE